MNKVILLKVIKEKVRNPLYLGFFVGSALIYFVIFIVQRNYLIDLEKIFTLISNVSFLFTIFLTTGIFGREISSGTIQLLLVRPISRSSVYFSKIVGIGVSAFIFLLFNFLVVFAFYTCFGTLELVKIIILFINLILFSILLIALLAFFSTFLPDYGDVVGVFVFFIISGALYEILAFLPSSFFKSMAEFIFRLLLGKIDVREWIGGSFLKSALLYIARISVFLLGGLVIFNRRDYGYGKG